MKYRITEWDERYEVNEKGRPCHDGDKKRSSPLEYIRLKVHGHSQGLGWRRLIAAVGQKQAPMVFGIFVKLLELAGDYEREGRGFVEDTQETPLSFVLSLDEEDIRFSLEALCSLKWLQKVAEPAGDCGDVQSPPSTPGCIREAPDVSGALLEPNRTETKLTETEPKLKSPGTPVGTWAALASRLRLLCGEDKTIGGRFGRIQAACGVALDERWAQDRLAMFLDQTESNAANGKRNGYLQTALDNFIREFNVP